MTTDVYPRENCIAPAGEYKKGTVIDKIPLRRVNRHAELS
jgi:hypothetical protein